MMYIAYVSDELWSKEPTLRDAVDAITGSPQYSENFKIMAYEASDDSYVSNGQIHTRVMDYKEIGIVNSVGDVIGEIG